MMPADSQPLSASQPTGDGLHLSVGGPIVSAGGTNGQALSMAGPERIAIWQLTEAFVRGVNGPVRDDQPSAAATPIWFFAFDDGSTDGPTSGSYRDASAGSRSVRVYHLGSFPGDLRAQLEAVAAGQAGETGIPKYGVGDRVLARFNNQSGRWEIIGPAEDIWRFELKTRLAPAADRNVPSTAEAYLVVYDTVQGRYVRTALEFQVADFLGVWDAQPGCRGYAKRMADSSSGVGWEVVLMASEFAPCTVVSSSSSGSA